MKAICLIVVHGGVSEVFTPKHVDCQVIDLDDIDEGGDPQSLPRGVGFEKLVRDAALEEGTDFVWEEQS
jgi:hypothetical protein